MFETARALVPSREHLERRAPPHHEGGTHSAPTILGGWRDGEANKCSLYQRELLGLLHAHLPPIGFSLVLCFGGPAVGPSLGGSELLKLLAARIFRTADEEAARPRQRREYALARFSRRRG